jgi:hypothetical protein
MLFQTTTTANYLSNFVLHVKGTIDWIFHLFLKAAETLLLFVELGDVFAEHRDRFVEQGSWIVKQLL